MRRLSFVLGVGAAGFAVLIALGLWQVGRLAGKEATLAAIAARMSEALPALPDRPEEARDEYRALRLRGEIEPGEAHVLFAPKGRGPGYLVIAPFRLADGRRILVERGWVPEGAKDAPRAGGPVEVEGNLLWPDDATSWTPPPDTARNIRFARDLAGLAAALGAEPVLLVARSSTGAGILPQPVGVNIPNDHLAYAITWFGLAAVWAAMTGLFLLRSRRR